MQHEIAEIKKSVKKYKTVKGIEKESISFYANLGSKSEFDDGDNVAVAPLDEFNKLNEISADEIQQLKNDAADKDAAIDRLNEINAKLKASEKNVADLRDNISKKDKIIAELESELKVADATIDDLSDKKDKVHSKLSDLSDVLSNKNSVIDDLDKQIIELEKEIAVLNVIDISELKEKAKDSDKANKIIIRLQNQIIELKDLLKYKDDKIYRLENKGLLDTILNKDVTADITAPTLYLIDSSGNLKDKKDINVAASDVGDDKPDDNSDKDTLTII